MKLTLGEALAAIDSLAILIDKEIEFKEAYWLGRATDQIQNELNAFNKARTKLIMKYGKKDKNGELIVKYGEKDKDGKPIERSGRYDIPDQEAFQKDFDEIANEEIEIKYKPISADKFEGINIAPRVLIGLGRLIEAPKE